MSNMKIWDAVSKTDPKYTKKVNQRGGFTAVGAQSQIMAATRQFGPIGVGWGYSVSEPIFHDRLVFVQVTLWHGDFNQTYGPMTGGCEWQDKNGRLDSDAPKKATTDALTKLLGQLGFNADVFLGRFDDNKYIEQMEREFAPEPSTMDDAQRGTIEMLSQATGVSLTALVNNYNKNNPGADAKDLRDVPASEFEAMKIALENRQPKNQKEAA